VSRPPRIAPGGRRSAPERHDECTKGQPPGAKSEREVAMRAMILEAPGAGLREADVPRPEPGPDQLLIRVRACGVCRTDLHVVDGELPDPGLPLVPGHEVVGTVVGKGERATRFREGDRVGVPWLGHTCGACRYCVAGRENLCDRPGFTGYTLDGGYA